MSVGVNLCGVKFECRLEKPGNSMSGHYADSMYTIELELVKTSGQYRVRL